MISPPIAKTDDDVASNGERAFHRTPLNFVCDDIVFRDGRLSGSIMGTTFI